MHHRTQPWRTWLAQVRTTLSHLDPGHVEPPARRFFALHYAAHVPTMFPAPLSGAQGWTRERLELLAGDIEVEVQAGRNSNSDYEVQSTSLKRRMAFREFLRLVHEGDGNDVYLTANNAAANRALTAALEADLLPLPPMLRQNAGEGFLWIGRDTVTPLHHDLTQNLMVQHVGRKLVRMVPPAEHAAIDNTHWVYSQHHWLGDEVVRERGITVQDYWIEPGDALFLPVGWWHCVKSEGVSITSTWTNFLWPNNWTAGFPS